LIILVGTKKHLRGHDANVMSPSTQKLSQVVSWQ
jgi:hypothetical protein